MSQENVEVVKVAYEAFARGGLDRYMEHFTDDVVYWAVEDGPDEPGPIHGKDAVRAWLQDWIDMFDGFRMEPVELIDAGGDTVVAVERFGGRAKLSGSALDETRPNRHRVPVCWILNLDDFHRGRWNRRIGNGRRGRQGGG